MTNLVNLVSVTVDPSVRTELLNRLWANVHAARKEDGCYQFEVSVSNTDPNIFIFYEVYKDEAALIWHREQDYFINYISYVESMRNKVNRSHTQYTIIDN
jgi:autoinducer 2-degrading protein